MVLSCLELKKWKLLNPDVFITFIDTYSKSTDSSKKVDGRKETGFFLE